MSPESMKPKQMTLGDRYVRNPDTYGLMMSLYKAEVKKYKESIKNEVKP